MRMLTKILPLLLSAAPITVLAMEVDDINPKSGNKRLHSSISAAEGESEPESRKKPRIEGQQIINRLDQVVPGEQPKDVYKGSEKYKKIADVKKSIESLKELDPELRKIFFGDDIEDRLREMETTSEQLMETYYCDFFARINAADFASKKVLPQEAIQNILFYCSMEDFLNLARTSHAARDAVYSLVPAFQKYFQNAIHYGQYKDINEFLDDFRKDEVRAYAAAGIASFINEQDKWRKTLLDSSSQSYMAQRMVPIMPEELKRRNKWLDEAFNARDMLATSFIFQNGLFISSKGQPDANLMGIIKEVYERQGGSRDLLLDHRVLDFLEHQLELMRACPDDKQIQSIIEMIQKYLPCTIRGNLILFEAFQSKIKANSGKGEQVILPFKNEIRKCFLTAGALANRIPNYFQRGIAHCELGLWVLAQKSWSTFYQGDSLGKNRLLGAIIHHWTQAVNAWTRTAEGDRQKAIAHFKAFVLNSNLFNQPLPYGTTNLLCDPASITSTIFLSTTKRTYHAKSGHIEVFFHFLSKLYDIEKQSNDQLHPYDKDVNMLLAAARRIQSNALFNYDYWEPTLETQVEIEAASNYYIQAIKVSLNNHDEEVKEKITTELDFISQREMHGHEKVAAYERIVEQLGLNPVFPVPSSAD